MKDLQIFENKDFHVRAYDEWFVGNDVSRCLGYKNVAGAIQKHVDDEDKKVEKIHNAQNGYGAQNTVLINESGVYSLIMGSKLASAKKFKRWVTSEVLPSIRKHGAYMTPETLSQSFKDPAFLKGLLVELIESQNTVAELKPLAENAKAFLLSETTISVGDFAKMLTKNGYLTGRNDLFRTLRGMGYLQYNNIPYQKYINQGIFSTVETLKGHYLYVTTRVTPKGQEYLLKTLRKEIY